MVVTRPESGSYTVADLEALSEGVRAELYDGQLIMRAAANRRHQRAVRRLAALLDTAVPENLEVVIAPFDWQITETLLLEPDLLVLPFVYQESRFVGTPHLVAEVLSPSTRVIDLTAKLRYYEEAAVPAYLVVDPDTPSIIIHELVDGELRVTAVAEGDDNVRLPVPFGLELTPAALV